MAFCRNCGTKVPGDSAFCPSCGAPQGVQPSAPASSAAQPASSGATTSRSKLPLIIAIVVGVLAACAVSGWFAIDFITDQAAEKAEAAAEAERESAVDAAEARPRAQAEAVADLIAGAMTGDEEMLRASVSLEYEDLLEEYRDMDLSEPSIDVSRDWSGDVLTLTLSNGDDELRVDITPDGNEGRAEVYGEFYFNGDYEEEEYATVEYENGRWVITEIAGEPIETWY